MKKIKKVYKLKNDVQEIIWILIFATLILGTLFYQSYRIEKIEKSEEVKIWNI